MKKISLKYLKENLSQLTEEAAQGAQIQVTKYNKPYIYIVGMPTSSLHIGVKIGKGILKSVSKFATKGAYLAELMKDRQEKDD